MKKKYFSSIANEKGNLGKIKFEIIDEKHDDITQNENDSHSCLFQDLFLSSH